MRKGGKQGVPSHNRMDFSEQEVKDIIELHINKKMSAYKISKKYNISQSPINRVLKENNEIGI